MAWRYCSRCSPLRNSSSLDAISLGGFAASFPQSMADLFEFASPEKVARLEAELADAQRAHAEAEELLENALTALDALGTVRARKRVAKKAAPKMRRPDNDEAVA